MISLFFCPTESECTTNAMVKFIHHTTLMLEENSYVRCLLVDFSKTFDVRHSVLLYKISSLNIPSYIRNWIVIYPIGQAQVCRTPDSRLSASQPITSSIVQGYGVGPTSRKLWKVIFIHFHELISSSNMLITLDC